MVEIYCDGACKGNPGPSGWGVFCATDSANHYHYGYLEVATNNIAEMTAMLYAIEMAAELNEPNVTIKTDSQYTVNGLTKWVSGWKAKGWKTASGSDVKNKELWIELYTKYSTLQQSCNVDIKWVKGHSGTYGNEMADELANLAIETKSTDKGIIDVDFVKSTSYNDA